MADRLRGKVAVITGAASGIGLATSHAFVEAGAVVVLAGREPTALDEAARQCQRNGGVAKPVPTDVRNEEQVRALAQTAVDEYGRLDIWVNNAAVTAFGRIEDVPSPIFHGLIETNFFGYLYGIRAVLPHFRATGGGVIVNVNSGVAFVCQPGTSAYVATKHALRALSSCLRMELSLEDARNIHVCDVYPASVDTPLFQHGANYSGRRIHPIPPVHEPKQVAGAILRAVTRHKRQTCVGVPRRTLLFLQALAPSLSERWIARYVAKRHFSSAPAEDSGGNIAHPAMSHAQMRGDWQE